MVSTLHTCDEGPTSHYTNCDRGGCGSNAYYVNPKMMCPEDSCTINTNKPYRIYHTQTTVFELNKQLKLAVWKANVIDFISHNSESKCQPLYFHIINCIQKHWSYRFVICFTYQFRLEQLNDYCLKISTSKLIYYCITWQNCGQKISVFQEKICWVMLLFVCLLFP